jgi:hypothetical protein
MSNQPERAEARAERRQDTERDQPKAKVPQSVAMRAHRGRCARIRTRAHGPLCGANWLNNRCCLSGLDVLRGTHLRYKTVTLAGMSKRRV